jgi:hypothetical protein
METANSDGSRPQPAQQPSPMQWEYIRPHFIHLYSTMGLPLHEVKRRLKAEHGFEATYDLSKDLDG